MELKYYNIEKKYLADALSFLGFKYYKFTGITGNTIFGFEDTPNFRNAMNGLFSLKNQFGTNK